jgi:ferrous iron transport protein B
VAWRAGGGRATPQAYLALLAAGTGVASGPAGRALPLLGAPAPTRAPQPSWRDAARAARMEVRATTGEFLRKALPVFAVLVTVAAALDHLGVPAALAGVLGGAMGLVGLPAEAAVPVLLSAIRKDGVLLLEAGAEALAGAQLVVAVFLAGSLTPCLLTAGTIARERGVRVAARLLSRQATTAVTVAVVVSLVAGVWP